MFFTILAVGGALYALGRAIMSSPAAAGEDSHAIVPVQTQASEIAEIDQDEFEKESERGLVLAGTSVALAGVGALIYRPFSLASAALTFYCSFPLFKEAHQAIFKERRLRASIPDSLAVVTLLFAGYYFLGALEGLLFRVSRKLLQKTEDRTRRKLVDIFGGQSRTAWLLKEGYEIEVPTEQLQVGDVIAVAAGQVIPVDGVIHTGTATIDQHMLTGESQPAEKGPGEPVLAATLVLSGKIHIKATKTGSSTAAANIGKLLKQTTDYRDVIISGGEKLADRAALPVMGLGAVGFFALGPQGASALLGSNFVPAARISIPLSMFNFLARASKQGILIKDGRAIELLSKVDTIVFDKTGTLTSEKPHLGHIHTCNGVSAEALLAYAAAAELTQSHPIALAIKQAARERLLAPLPAPEQSTYQVGYGIHATLAGHKIRVGSSRFMTDEGIAIPDALARIQTQTHAQGSSLVYVAIDGQLAGALELRSTIRPEVPEVIAALRECGLSLYVISGDHEEPTRQLAAELGIARYFAEVLPQDKAALVQKLQREGRVVCFVGDGINDSIALKTADASISLSGATTVATDTAQIVMMDGTLRGLPQTFAIAREFHNNTKINLALSVGFSVFCVGGVLFLNFGILASIILWNSCLLLSIGNSMLPALKDSMQKSN